MVCDFGPWRGPCEVGCVSRAGDLGRIVPGVFAVEERVTSFVLWPPSLMNSFFPQMKLTDWKQFAKTLGKYSPCSLACRGQVLSRVADLGEDQPWRREQLVFSSPRSPWVTGCLELA